MLEHGNGLMNSDTNEIFSLDIIYNNNYILFSNIFQYNYI